MNNELLEQLKEFRIIQYAERAYHYAYPHFVNNAHKKRAIENMKNFYNIKDDF